MGDETETAATAAFMLSADTKAHNKMVTIFRQPLNNH